MAEAGELKKGDARLGEELTAPESLRGGSTWSLYGADTAENPSTVWREMTAEDGAAAIRYYDAMEAKDGHYAAQLQTRKDAVLSKDVELKTYEEGARADRVKAFCQEQIDRFDDFEGVVRQILDSLGSGVAVAELMYAREGGRIVLEDLRFRNPARFRFGPLGGPQTGPPALRDFSAGADAGEPLPKNKMLVATFQERRGNRWGDPLGRHCWWPSWFKRQTLKFWLRMAEKGPGSVVTQYPRGSEEEERQNALEAARAINEDTAVALPEGMPWEIAAAAREGRADVFQALVQDWANGEISEVILGQTLTSAGSDRGSGSLALGEVHNDVRQEKTSSDARLAGRVVTLQIFAPLIALNFGPDAPRVWYEIQADPEEDQDAKAKRYRTFVDMGLPVPVAHALEQFGIPELEQGQEVLRARGGQSRRGLSPGLALAGAPDPEPERLAEAGTRAAAAIAGDWIGELVERAARELPEESEEGDRG